MNGDCCLLFRLLLHEYGFKFLRDQICCRWLGRNLLGRHARLKPYLRAVQSRTRGPNPKRTQFEATERRTRQLGLKRNGEFYRLRQSVSRGFSELLTS